MTQIPVMQWVVVVAMLWVGVMPWVVVMPWVDKTPELSSVMPILRMVAMLMVGLMTAQGYGLARIPSQGQACVDKTPEYSVMHAWMQ